MASKSPVLLTPQERDRLTGVPSNLTECEIARYYTLSPQDLQAALRHRRPHNRLGFAVQLCMLRFPGRALPDLPEVPAPILVYIAKRVEDGSHGRKSIRCLRPEPISSTSAS
jgi:TnpA family transposase